MADDRTEPTPSSSGPASKGEASKDDDTYAPGGSDRVRAERSSERPTDEDPARDVGDEDPRRSESPPRSESDTPDNQAERSQKGRSEKEKRPAEDVRASKQTPAESTKRAPRKKRKGVFGVIGETFSEFAEDNCTTMAAALSYYTIFSLPPLLIIVIFVAGLFLSPAKVEEVIQQQASGLVGQQGAQQIATMIENAGNLGQKGFIGLIAGIGGLLFGATGAFAQLQTALNRAWEIEKGPDKSGIIFIIFKRVLSLGMVLGIAFLLLVSLVLSAALSALSGWLAQFMPGGLSAVALYVLDVIVSLGIITLLFATIYKVLPDAKIAWRDVWMGGFVTAVLFVAGKFAIGFYLGKSNPGEAFGAAGSLALILVWVYYSAMIVFLGAEFTQSWAKHRGKGIRPSSGAVRTKSSPAKT